MAGESEGHRQLKRGAFLWAQSRGYTACAEEVRIPKSGYRADVVGCKPAVGGCAGLTAIFECKWSRADFLGDSSNFAESASRLEELHQRRKVLENNLGTHHPGLRAGETLFPEYDVVDFDQLDHRTYKSVVREIQVMQRRMRSGSKFDKIANYHSADLCYLVVRKGICGPEEIPPGWGLLEWDGQESVTNPVTKPDPDPDSDGSGDIIENGEIAVPHLDLTIRPQKRDCAEVDRLAMLRRVAEAATRLGNRKFEIGSELLFSERRKRKVGD